MPSSNQTIIIATDDNQLIDGQLKTLFGRPWKELVEHFAIFEKLNITSKNIGNYNGKYWLKNSPNSSLQIEFAYSVNRIKSFQKL